MAKIHGGVFLSIGVLVYIVSYYVNEKYDNSSMLLFIYASYLLIAYGIAKLVIGYILYKGKKENDMLPDKIPDLKLGGGLAAGRQKQPDSHLKNFVYGYIGYCQNCGTPMRRINIYCHRCGKKQNF